MSEVKTELASLEEHHNALHKAIERRAYTLYDLDGCKDGNDQEHWFRAERGLTVQDIPFSIESDAASVRLAIDMFPLATLVLSISPRSILIFSLSDDASNDCEHVNRDLVRVISLPLEVDSARVTCELDDRDLTLRLPLANGTLVE